MIIIEEVKKCFDNVNFICKIKHNNILLRMFFYNRKIYIMKIYLYSKKPIEHYKIPYNEINYKLKDMEI